MVYNALLTDKACSPFFSSYCDHTRIVQTTVVTLNINTFIIGKAKINLSEIFWQLENVH